MLAGAQTLATPTHPHTGVHAYGRASKGRLREVHLYTPTRTDAYDVEDSKARPAWQEPKPAGMLQHGATHAATVPARTLRPRASPQG